MDFDWRLDYSVRSSMGGRDTRAVYLTTFKILMPTGGVRSLSVFFTFEQIQQLAQTVKDLVKQVDRIVKK